MVHKCSICGEASWLFWQKGCFCWCILVLSGSIPATSLRGVFGTNEGVFGTKQGVLGAFLHSAKHYVVYPGTTHLQRHEQFKAAWGAEFRTLGPVASIRLQKKTW